MVYPEHEVGTFMREMLREEGVLGQQKTHNTKLSTRNPRKYILGRKISTLGEIQALSLVNQTTKAKRSRSVLCGGTTNKESKASTVNPHPSTLKPQPSSLIPHPSTLIPQPSSLIHHPSSLKPQPKLLTPNSPTGAVSHVSRSGGGQQGLRLCNFRHVVARPR